MPPDPIILDVPPIPLLGENNKTVAMRAFDSAIREIVGQALGYNLPPQALGMNLLSSALSLFVQGEVAGMMRAVQGAAAPGVASAAPMADPVPEEPPPTLSLVQD